MLKPFPSKSALPPPPDHLEPPEAALWAKVVSQFHFSDAASLSLLQAAMEGHQRARRCREIIDRDGEAVADRFGQTKAHPLLHAERDAKTAFYAGLRHLNLDLGKQ